MRLELESICSSWMGIRQLLSSGRQGIIPTISAEWEERGFFWGLWVTKALQGIFGLVLGFPGNPGNTKCRDQGESTSPGPWEWNLRQLPLNPDFRAQLCHLNLNFRAQLCHLILVLEVSCSEPDLSQVFRRIPDISIPWRQQKIPMLLLEVGSGSCQEENSLPKIRD